MRVYYINQSKCVEIKIPYQKMMYRMYGVNISSLLINEFFPKEALVYWAVIAAGVIGMPILEAIETKKESQVKHMKDELQYYRTKKAYQEMLDEINGVKPALTEEELLEEKVKAYNFEKKVKAMEDELKGPILKDAVNMKGVFERMT